MGNDPKPKNKRPTSPEQPEVSAGREFYHQVEKDEAAHFITRESDPKLDRIQKQVYRQALRALNKNKIPYVVAAAFARHIYTNIWRKTKDLDIFITPDNLKAAFDALQQAGFETEIKAEHWLAKAWKDDHFIDLIFGTNNGLVPVSEDMFEGSKIVDVLGVPARLIPLEEMIAISCYVAGRNRFDGPEIVHLIRSSKGKLDWERIVQRLDENSQLLLWQLILFDFVYPGHANYLPQDLMEKLYVEMKNRWQSGKTISRSERKKFRGTLLDPYSYTVDIEDWGYEDARQQDPLVDEEGGAL